jgi:BirA family biotin operon repressor/biotin-[acetyl-CoA-carboxylase] ligase
VTYDGHSATELAARLRTPYLTLAAEVTSTLDVLHDLAAGDAPAGTTVLADTQTRGRGRQGRAWHSPAGTGIWLGFLVRSTDAAAAGLLAIRSGLAVAAALEQLGFHPALKWPNDALLADRKVAGILCETRWRGTAPAWTAVGIGMNVHGPLPADLAGGACALDEHAPIARVDVLAELLPRLHALPGLPQLAPAEGDAWHARDWLAGRRLRAPEAGIARGIDPSGALRVECADGIRRVLAGHVELA